MRLNARYQKHNPLRRPNWRFRRLVDLCNRFPCPGRTSRHDDNYIRVARGFLLRYRRCDAGSMDRELLWLQLSDLYRAYEIYEHRHIESASASLEARILAGQAPEEIGPLMSITAETVSWYAALFFDVADQLQQRDWLMSQVLLPGLARARAAESSDDEDDTRAPRWRAAFEALKLMAYLGGPAVLDSLLTGYTGRHPTADGAKRWLDDFLVAQIMRRAAVACCGLDGDGADTLSLLEMALRGMALQDSPRRQAQARSTLERHIQGMLENLPFTVGDDGEARYRDHPIGEYDRHAAELRDEELMRVAAGEPLPASAQGIESRRLPPARGRPQGSPRTAESDLE